MFVTSGTAEKQHEATPLAMKKLGGEEKKTEKRNTVASVCDRRSSLINVLAADGLGLWWCPRF